MTFLGPAQDDGVSSGSIQKAGMRRVICSRIRTRTWMPTTFRMILKR
jgi:hypothetical protein